MAGVNISIPNVLFLRLSCFICCDGLGEGNLQSRYLPEQTKLPRKQHEVFQLRVVKSNQSYHSGQSQRTQIIA